VTDGQTDRRTEFSSLDRVCIACSAVKMNLNLLIHVFGIVYPIMLWMLILLTSSKHA